MASRASIRYEEFQSWKAVIVISNFINDIHICERLTIKGHQLRAVKQLECLMAVTL